jgi:hypothetical protein
LQETESRDKETRDVRGEKKKKKKEEAQTERQTDREQRETERGEEEVKHRQRDRQRDRETERDTERQRETETERDRQTDRETDRGQSAPLPSVVFPVSTNILLLRRFLGDIHTLFQGSGVVLDVHISPAVAAVRPQSRDNLEDCYHGCG